MRKSLLIVIISIFVSNSAYSSGNKELVSEQPEVTHLYIDSKGREVQVKKNINSIISLAPNLTEIIFELNAADKLIGRTDYCDYPSDVSNIESIGTLFDPDIEKIVELNPDIVIASSHFKQEILLKLEEIGLTVVIIQEEGSFSGVYKTIEDIGLLINRKTESEKLIMDMKTRVSNITNKVSGKQKPVVYYVVAYGEYGDFTAGGDTFISELIELSGGTNAAKEISGWSYSLEKIIEDNPDIFICSKYNNTREDLMNATGYKDIPSVKNGKVFPVDNNLLDRQGPRIIFGLEVLAKILHPECF